MNFRFFFQSSIRTRVLVLVLTIVLVGMWALVFLTRHTLSSNLENLFKEQQLAASFMAASGINHDLRDRMAVLTDVARQAAGNMAGGPETMQRCLEQGWGMQTHFSGGIYALGLDGVVIAAVPESAAARIGQSYRDEECIARALQGASVIGPPTLSKHTQTPGLIMAVPIYDGKHEVIGVLAGVNALHTLTYISSLESRYARDVRVIDPKQRLTVTAMDPTLTMTPLPLPGVDAQLDDLVSGRDRVGITQALYSETMVVAATSVPITGWIVLTSLPLNKLIAPWKVAQKNLLLAAITLTTVIVFAVGWVLTRQLNPLIHAARALAHMSDNGEIPTPLPVARPDEVGLLISSFNQALKELLQNQSLLKQMMETSNAAIFLMDMHRVITYANPRMAEMFGLSGEELLGREYLSLVHESHLEETRAKTRAVMDETEVSCTGHERLYVRQNGTKFWGRLNGQILFDPDGSRLGLVTVMIDISENKRYERELQLAASVFSHAQEGIIIADASKRIIDVNGAFCRMSGYSREEAVGKSPVDIVRSGHHSPEFYNNLEMQIVQHGYWSGEIWNRRKDGSLHPELLTISAVRNEHGDISHYVAICTDISILKEHERQLETMAHHDALTGLPNRLLLADRLERAMHHAERTAKPLALIYLDIDEFKEINDCHGHDVGDQALISVAERLQGVLRESDTIARLGGDEFVLLLPDMETTEDCIPTLTRLMAAFRQPARLEGLELQLSVSLGVTFYPQTVPIDADHLLRQADTAMYQAKLAGKGRFHFFTANPDAPEA